MILRVLGRPSNRSVRALLGKVLKDTARQTYNFTFSV